MPGYSLLVLLLMIVLVIEGSREIDYEGEF
jgi:hypothetical protein